MHAWMNAWGKKRAICTHSTWALVVNAVRSVRERRRTKTKNGRAQVHVGRGGGASQQRGKYSTAQHGTAKHKYKLSNDIRMYVCGYVCMRGRVEGRGGEWGRGGGLACWEGGGSVARWHVPC